MLLHRQVGVALEEEQVLILTVGALKAAGDIAELERSAPVDLATDPFAVDQRQVRLQRVLDRADRRQLLVFDLDQTQRLLRRLLIDRGHRRDRLAVIANLLERQRVLVLRHRHDPIADRQVRPREDTMHARQRRRLADIDAHDLRVAVRAPQQLADERPRQVDVVGIDRLPRGLRVGVDPGVAPADGGGAPGGGPFTISRNRRHAAPRIRAAASSTASMIAR